MLTTLSVSGSPEQGLSALLVSGFSGASWLPSSLPGSVKHNPEQDLLPTMDIPHLSYQVERSLLAEGMFVCSRPQLSSIHSHVLTGCGGGYAWQGPLHLAFLAALRKLAQTISCFLARPFSRLPCLFLELALGHCSHKLITPRRALWSRIRLHLLPGFTDDHVET